MTNVSGGTFQGLAQCSVSFTIFLSVILLSSQKDSFHIVYLAKSISSHGNIYLHFGSVGA